MFLWTGPLKLFVSNSFGSSHLTIAISNFSSHLTFSVFQLILVENFLVTFKGLWPLLSRLPGLQSQAKRGPHTICNFLNCPPPKLLALHTDPSQLLTPTTWKKNPTTATQNLLSQPFIAIPNSNSPASWTNPKSPWNIHFQKPKINPP
jgi:hypothetical protein